ncbi:DUF4197 domain-containing protein [Bacteroidota bacterium]
MKKLFVPIAIVVSMLSLTLTSCDQIVGVLEGILTEGDAADGLKEALRVGADTAVANGGEQDGYFKNKAIKILLPPEGKVIVDVINSVPGGPVLVDQVVLKLNRAAEKAAPAAKDILVDAIVGITISDAISIVNGSNDAATQYLRSKTQPKIAAAFKPEIQKTLESVGAQDAWGQLTTNYNFVAPLLQKPTVNTDLADYTTNKALDGLFHLVAEEEGKIREDPLHRVSEILAKVFGK